MTALAFESVGELFGLLLSALAASGLTVIGALAENAGLDALAAGQSVLGAWELGMGALALYAGIYMLGYQRVWQRLRRTDAAN